jgi:hypothetical protein
VQGATDAARAAADLVLTGEGLSTIIDGIEVARETFARLKNFISYRIAATLQLLLFFFIALFAFPPEYYYNKYGFKLQTGNYTGLYVQVPRRSPYCLTGVAHLCLCDLSLISTPRLACLVTHTTNLTRHKLDSLGLSPSQAMTPQTCT